MRSARHEIETSVVKTQIGKSYYITRSFVQNLTDILALIDFFHRVVGHVFTLGFDDFDV